MAVIRAFDKLNVASEIVCASDGAEALDVMRGTGGKEKIQYPYVVLLDLNMPRMDGFEFLDELRKDEALRQPVVFVLTTSNLEQDRLDSYNKSVAGYIVKQRAGEDFMSMISMLDSYWKIVDLPTDSSWHS